MSQYTPDFPAALQRFIQAANKLRDMAMEPPGDHWEIPLHEYDAALAALQAARPTYRHHELTLAAQFVRKFRGLPITEELAARIQRGLSEYPLATDFIKSLKVEIADGDIRLRAIDGLQSAFEMTPSGDPYVVRGEDGSLVLYCFLKGS